MKRAIFGAWLVCAALTVACDKKSSDAEPAASASAHDTAAASAQPVASASAAPAPLTDDDLPVKADFASTVRKDISPTTYKSALDGVEKDIAKK